MKKSDLKVGHILVSRDGHTSILQYHEEFGLYMSNPSRKTRQQIRTFLNEDLDCVVSGRERTLCLVFGLPPSFPEEDIVEVYQGTDADLSTHTITTENRTLLWSRLN